MKVFTTYFSEDQKVSLTGFLLDASREMPNMENRPAVLVIPGGGYRMCSDREAEPIAMLFAQEGYHTFVLRYTVGETGTFTFEQPFGDAVRALKYIRENAAEFHVLPDKIAAIGFSAGGHLASSLGTISPHPGLPLYPPEARRRSERRHSVHRSVRHRGHAAHLFVRHVRRRLRFGHAFAGLRQSLRRTQRAF